MKMASRTSNASIRFFVANEFIIAKKNWEKIWIFFEQQPIQSVCDAVARFLKTNQQK